MPNRNLTIKERVKVINNSENSVVKVKDLSKSFRVSPWTVRRILQNKQPLQEAFENGQTKRTRLEKRSEVTDFDNKVKHWIDKCAKQGIPLSATIIIEYAKQQSDGAKGSWGWFDKFKSRINLKFGTTHGQRLSVDMEKVQRFKEITIPRLMINWQNEFVYNCDETALFWRQAPVKTFFISKSPHIGDKLFNERITILFTVNRNGDKLEPFVINRAAHPRCFYSNCLEKLDIAFTAQKNAWMDRFVFTDYLTRLNESLKKEDKKIVLLLDNFSGHKVNFEDFSMISFQFLPSGTTSLTQPLDGGIIKSFKSKYLSLLMRKIISEIGSSHISDFVKKLNLLDALQWVNTAWKDVSRETIVNCWCHCGYIGSIQENYISSNCENNDLNDLLSALNNLSVNTCSLNDLMESQHFEFINYFDD